MRERHTDILIIGGGLGGVAAALAALRLGQRVILTESSDWLGGQLTAQAVPPDEHDWIEERGCTASYRRLRDGIRQYYRDHYPLSDTARAQPLLNPGRGNVSRVCHEPRVGLAVIEAMLAPYRADGQLTVLLGREPLSAETDGDKVRAVTVAHSLSGEREALHAPFILDATELGDLLELARVEHVIGSESQRDTEEPHALPGAAAPLDQQAISWCFALDYLPAQDHTIAQPEDYAFWRTYQAEFWPGPQLGWVDVSPDTLQPRTRTIFDGPPEREYSFDFWHYRRIFYSGHYAPGRYASDITMVNWPQIDYWLGPIVGVSAAEREQHLRGARQLSLSWLYWMQTAAPRHDGGQGYPGLRLRPDVMGSEDGLAKQVYIRESRRLLAEQTVLEQHVGVAARPAGAGAESFHDSVGVGSYRIDLHPSTGLRTYVDIDCYPFQIPLGALIPRRVENLLAAGKNLGVTHITNGCYRLHPVEWNTGEAAGALAAHCLRQNLSPRAVRNTPALLADFQRLLTEKLGFELHWPEHIRSAPARMQ
jgi:FAD dependent oxidoreductase